MEKKLRELPRFSVNKLGEYMVATPRRRRSLIIEHLRRLAVKTITYEDARPVLTRFYGDPTRTPRQLLDEAIALRDRAAQYPDEEYRANCLKAAARAIEAFAPMAEQVRSKRFLAIHGPRRNANLMLSGVTVGVNPDVCLLERGTERRIGALKFHFPRKPSLSLEALQYIATLLYHYLEKQGDSPQRRECISIDVFSAQYASAPRATSSRLKNVEAACEEIAERWPAIYDSLIRDGLISE